MVSTDKLPNTCIVVHLLLEATIVALMVDIRVSLTWAIEVPQILAIVVTTVLPLLTVELGTVHLLPDIVPRKLATVVAQTQAILVTRDLPTVARMWASVALEVEFVVTISVPTTEKISQGYSGHYLEISLAVNLLPTIPLFS